MLRRRQPALPPAWPPRAGPSAAGSRRKRSAPARQPSLQARESAPSTTMVLRVVLTTAGDLKSAVGIIGWTGLRRRRWWWIRPRGHRLAPRDAYPQPGDGTRTDSADRADGPGRARQPSRRGNIRCRRLTRVGVEDRPREVADVAAVHVEEGRGGVVAVVFHNLGHRELHELRRERPGQVVGKAWMDDQFL